VEVWQTSNLRTLIGVKFGMEEGTSFPSSMPNFTPIGAMLLSLRGEKPQNRHLSRLNIGALRFAQCCHAAGKMLDKSGTSTVRESCKSIEGLGRSTVAILWDAQTEPQLHIYRQLHVYTRTASSSRRKPQLAMGNARSQSITSVRRLRSHEPRSVQRLNK